MPTKKSPTKAKPKTPAKKALKAAPKAAPKAKAAKPKTPQFPVKHHTENSGRGFMWKLLEQKQADQKKRANLPPGHMPETENSKFHDEPGHSRFNGPRRRVG